MLTQLTENHVDAVLGICQQCYPNPEYWETRTNVMTKLHNYSPGCIGWEEDGKLVAYYLFWPWNKVRSYPLDREDCWLNNQQPTVMYSHDICILPSYRGKGIAQELLSSYETQARELGLRVGVGTAVRGTWVLWKRWGWEPVERVNYGPEEAWLILKFLS
jgi:GNAT superfamily N-acetyltransferase